MLFTIHSLKDRKIEKFYNNAIKELNSFYRVDWNRNKPKVFLISSREEFDKLYGKKTEEWVVGTTLGSSHNIYLLSPDVYESESNHKYSDEEYEALLKHEISHLYTRTFCKQYQPLWLIEGIAILSSGQLERKPAIKQFENFLKYFNEGGPGLYGESGYAVELLDKEFGREKLLKFLKLINGVTDEDDFKKLFKKTFKIELSYDWFNKKI